jgi:hypothetical protein
VETNKIKFEEPNSSCETPPIMTQAEANPTMIISLPWAETFRNTRLVGGAAQTGVQQPDTPADEPVSPFGEFAVAAVTLGEIGDEQVDESVVELCRHQQADLIHIAAVDPVLVNQQAPRGLQRPYPLAGSLPVGFRRRLFRTNIIKQGFDSFGRPVHFQEPAGVVALESDA